MRHDAHPQNLTTGYHVSDTRTNLRPHLHDRWTRCAACARSTPCWSGLAGQGRIRTSSLRDSSRQADRRTADLSMHPFPSRGDAAEPGEDLGGPA